MKNIFSSFLVLALTAAFASVAPLAATASTPTTVVSGQEQNLPMAQGMKRIKLPNGLTVYLYPRNDPTQSVELRLIVRVGSLQEKEDERGLAHFVEHMAFNGTTDFPGQTLFKRLEQHGIMLGADVNAVTSLASTTYKLSLPRNAGESVKEGIHTLAQWAHAITFDPQAFDREREIIVSEWRLRQGIGWRINEPLRQLRYKGSASEDRDPIGLIDIVRHAPVERAKAFYERWYQPQNMTIIAVGAFDVDQLESWIKEYFGALTKGNNTTPVVWGVFSQPRDPQALTRLIFDPEQSDRFVQVMLQQQLAAPFNTLNEQWRDTLQQLLLDILSHRFSLMRDHELAESLQAPQSSWPLSSTQTQVVLLARPKTGQSYEDALRLAAAELRRLSDLGPTTDELNAAKKRRLERIKDQSVNYARYSSAKIADDFADSVVYQMPMLDKPQQYQMLTTFLKSATVNHIRASAQNLLSATVKIAAVGPLDKNSAATTVTSLRDAWDQGAGKPQTTPFALKQREAVLPPVPPAASGCAKRKTLLQPTSSGTIEECTLKNGLKFLVMSDPELTGSISLNLRVAGGTSSVTDSGLTRVPTALGLPMQCGIGALSVSDIVLLERKNKIQIHSYAEQLYHGLRAEGEVESLPAMMSIITQRLNAPRFCSSALATGRERALNQLQHEPAERRFMEAIYKEAFVNGGQMVTTEKSILAGGNEKDFAALEAQLLGNPAKMVVSIASKESADRIINAVTPWLNSLKKRSEGMAGWKDLGIVPTKDTGTVTFDWASSPKSMVQLHYRTPVQWTQEKADQVTLIGLVANLVLRERLRTQLSGVYTVMMNNLLAREPEAFYLGRLNFTAAPEREQELTTAAKEAIADFANKGLFWDEFKQAKQMARVNLQRQRKDTYYWSETLAQSMGSQERLQAIAQEPDRLEKQDFEKTNALLKELLLREPKVFVLTPKKS